MAVISNYGTLKAELSAYLFHQRLANRYDSCVNLFEIAANTRLRVRQMETQTFLQTDIAGNVALPADYLVWRTVLQDNPSIPAAPGRQIELDYVHPAYLKSTNIERAGRPKLFTIEGPTLIVRPPDVNAVINIHYYGKIPSIVVSPVSDAADNWLILEYPNAYLYGVLTELSAAQRNAEMAQLYKSRRDEAFQEITQLSALTTGATSPQVRTAEYF